MFWIRQILSTLLILFLVLFYLSLSSISMDSLMDPTQTGKTIYFFSVGLVLLTFVALFILSGHHKKIHISILDALFSVWFVYIITKSIIQRESFSFHFAEFVCLAILYLILRIIKKQFPWLFLALIVGGIIQAIYGNLQLWGYYPSNHNLFKLTGSFFNPGPYAGYLASVFPAALGFWLFSIRITNEKNNPSLSKINNLFSNVLDTITTWINKAELTIKKFEAGNHQKNLTHEIINYLAVIALISIILVLPASRSRAAWLAILGASGYLFAIKYKDYFKKWYDLSFAIKFSLIIFTVGVLSLGLTGVYLMKKNSADGRLLVWKITANMIADHPITGTGMDGFKAHYMDYQAEYFRQNPDSEEEMVAGDTNYAFNELLQQMSKHGFIGGFLLVLVIMTAIFARSYHGKTKTNKNNQNFTLTDKNLVIVSKAILISIVLFSMFSYPGQILPIKTSLILALAYLSGSMKNLHLFSMVKNKNQEAVQYSGSLSGIKNYIVRVTFFLTIVVLIFYGIRYIKTEVAAYKSWNYAFSIYNMGAYEQSIKEYEKALPVLKQNGDYLTNYGKALSMAGENEKAIEILQEAAEYFPNPVVYTALGDSYKAIEQNTKAEAAYLHAWFMNPSRFYPKYLLAKLYDETGQKFKAVKIAKELLVKEIKIQSTAVKEIIGEMQEIIKKYETNSTLHKNIKLLYNITISENFIKL